jgi:glycosyltransferase involved in cell wall biosynthesis
MRIVINAQIEPRTSGGIAQVLLGLAHGFSKLEGPEEYVFVCSPASAEWLHPYLGRNARVHVNDRSTPAPRRGIRVSDGFWESLDPGVIHFPYQAFSRTAAPSLFNPHDLQHVHLPEHFTEDEIERREALYGEACRSATAIVAASDFVRRDLADHFGLPLDKIHVIGWGSPTHAYQCPDDSDPAKVLRRFELQPGFAIYPAQTWPHKNHLNLLEALRIVRDRHGVEVPLVCTGALTDHWPALQRHVNEWSLAKQVRFLGRIGENELLALYRAARFMIVPTLFEAISFPLLEAFAESIPVACSNVTSLPEQVADAGLLFNPRDIEAIAIALYRLYIDADLRNELSQRGRQRSQRFSWRETAMSYRVLYRRVAHGTTTPAHRTEVPET